jgi:hypothetical protein
MWIIFGLLASILGALQTEINKNYKMDGFRLNTYRSFISMLFFIPFLGLIEWNLPLNYYLMVFIIACFSVLFMMMQYNLATAKNGRIANLFRPVSIIITFVFWLAINPEQRAFIANNSFNFVMIISSFVLFFIGFQMTRKSDIGPGIMLKVIEIAIFNSMCVVINKFALGYSENVFGAALNLVLICNLFMFLISFPIFLYMHQKQKLKFTKQDFQCSFYVSLVHTSSWVLFCLALYYASNPAYVSVLLGLTPVWFLIYYKVLKQKDDASPVGGLIMALAAILIIIFG